MLQIVRRLLRQIEKILIDYAFDPVFGTIDLCDLAKFSAFKHCAYQGLVYDSRRAAALSD